MGRAAFMRSEFHFMCLGKNRPWQQGEGGTLALAFQSEHAQNHLAFCGVAKCL